MRLHFGTCILFAAVALFATTSVYATALPAGATLYPAPGEPDPTAGGVVDTMTVPFAAVPLYTGTLTSTVWMDPANPLGGLTFIYQLTNIAGSIDAIHRLTINNFAGFSVDASFMSPTAGLPPTLIDRAASGGTVGFSFIAAPVGPGDLTPGSVSALLVLETNAPTYVTTFASVINGTVTNVPSFAPNPVPEPSTVALLALGGGVAALYGYRRRRARRS